MTMHALKTLVMQWKVLYSCDSELGCTSQTDYDACTTDTCDAENGCTYTPVNCNDNYLCTSNSCDSTTGNCNNTYISCDDENACMDDSCNALTGCTYCAVICDYYNACTPRLMWWGRGLCIYRYIQPHTDLLLWLSLFLLLVLSFPPWTI